jgi:DNA-binding NarL/FixJ family response regulator
VSASAAERGVVGRDSELSRVDAFVAGAGAARALILTGEAGIGKTTIWEAGIDAARERGLGVLEARSSSAETQLAFGGLIDLFDGVGAAELSDLPAPQRAALEVAMLRAEPSGRPAEPHAIGLGVLNAIRSLSSRGPLLVAVDDLQWLDGPSAEALGFAARRLHGADVRFLMARRDGPAPQFEDALARGQLDRVPIGGLSLGAARRMLSERLGLGISRQLLRRTVEVTLGNPLFVLEVGRALREAGVAEAGAEVPIPAGIEEMLGTRVASLPAHLRPLLVAVALTASPTTAELAALAGEAAFEEAVDSGLLLVARNRVRAAHPLLAAAARSGAGRAELRSLHRALAGLLADPEMRAMHLALAADRPEGALADTLAAVAAGAAARGAREQAVQLAEHALRLTPADAPVRSERVLLAAGYLEAAGDMERMTEMVSAELSAIPSGLPRARALLLLSEGTGPQTMTEMQGYRDRALAECGDDPGLCAVVLARRASNRAASAVVAIGEAEGVALEALGYARRASPAVERTALYALAWTRALAGRSVDDLCEQARTAEDSGSYIAASPERVAGQRLVWRGEVENARSTLTRFMALADARGERESYALLRLHMCELHLRVGEWEAVGVLLEDWSESSDRELMFRPKYERCRALLAAGRGDAEQARHWGSLALERAGATECRWDGLEALRALGIAALLEHRPAQAAASLREVWEHAAREGVLDPGVFPVAPELVEALVELRELEEASAVVARIRELADAQEHPWGAVTARRCAALVALAAARHDEQAAGELALAAEDYAGLGLRFDSARTLLSLGREQRRLKQWGGARRSLEAAAAAFAATGAEGWAKQALAQSDRVGARKPRPSGELTEAELRVARCAADGLSNKQIAQDLVVSVHTVEVHLSRAYAKLGISSRGQLTSRLSGWLQA